MSQNGKIKLDQGEEERPIIKASQSHHHIIKYASKEVETTQIPNLTPINFI
jgi:hypothetical protein